MTVGSTTAITSLRTLANIYSPLTSQKEVVSDFRKGIRVTAWSLKFLICWVRAEEDT